MLAGISVSASQSNGSIHPLTSLGAVKLRLFLSADRLAKFRWQVRRQTRSATPQVRSRWRFVP